MPRESMLPLRITPAEAERLAGADLGLLPQNIGELQKQMVEGAAGAKENIADGIERHMEMTESSREALKNLIPYVRIIKRYPWLGTFLLDGSTRIEEN
jgi:hypothetical protein